MLFSRRNVLKYVQIGALLFFGARCHAADDIVIADFEGDTYGAWTTTGDAFGTGPAHGAINTQMPVTGFQGKGLVNSFTHGDASTGTLTSPDFVIERNAINFLIGGGRHPGQTCLNLIVADKVVRTATGRDNENLDWASWDVASLKGKSAKLQIVDSAIGGWGHISLDQITMSDVRKAPVIMSDVLYSETYRPQFHFTSQTNWLNDPNGLVFFEGEYHLFFQHNPVSVDWGNMTWGHAVSHDLVHWKQLPDALKPDKLGTMFSGSAVVDWHNSTGFAGANSKQPPLIAMYTAAGGTNPESKGVPFSQCIAFSLDKGRTFTKFEGNPVLPHIAGENRDPKLVWFEPTKKWVLALYLDGDEYALFTSPDLKAWTNIQKLKMPGVSECPDFFPTTVQGENTHKWIFTGANGHYVSGDFDGSNFRPDGPPQVADSGANYYAVQTYSDIPSSDGRRIQIAWMNGGKYPEMPFNQQMSFPCELTLHRTGDGLRLRRWPVKEIQNLYAASKVYKPFVMSQQEDALSDFTAAHGSGIDSSDVTLEFEKGQSTLVRLRVRGEDITYDAKAETITCLGRTSPLPAINGKVSIRLLIDRTSIELFGNGGTVSMSSCFVPAPGNHELKLFVEGAAIPVSILTVHTLKSAWK